MRYKRPKLLFCFGGYFGFLEFTIFRLHLSCEFPANGCRRGRKAGQRQTTTLPCGNSGRGIQWVTFMDRVLPKERYHLPSRGETYAKAYVLASQEHASTFNPAGGKRSVTGIQSIIG